jgi:methylenetetrahydrofolate dehydrogenase (NADP+)/methenyltetrahydrofolate cyclohydrolase
MAELIDGKAISQAIKDEIREETLKLAEKKLKPCLAVILCGNDPASTVYVANKKKACEYCGFDSLSLELPEETTEEELLKKIDELNRDDRANGILVQLPLPSHINEDAVIAAIAPEKDVDGFHAVNVGNLLIGRPGFVSCTPAGVIQLLKRSNVEISGKECVVIGRSNIFFKPMSLLMLK